MQKTVYNKNIERIEFVIYQLYQGNKLSSNDKTFFANLKKQLNNIISNQEELTEQRKYIFNLYLQMAEKVNPKSKMITKIKQFLNLTPPIRPNREIARVSKEINLSGNSEVEILENMLYSMGGDGDPLSKMIMSYVHHDKPANDEMMRVCNRDKRRIEYFNKRRISELNKIVISPWRGEMKYSGDRPCCMCYKPNCEGFEIKFGIEEGYSDELKSLINKERDYKLNGEYKFWIKVCPDCFDVDNFTEYMEANDVYKVMHYIHVERGDVKLSESEREALLSLRCRLLEKNKAEILEEWNELMYEANKCGESAYTTASIQLFKKFL